MHTKRSYTTFATVAASALGALSVTIVLGALAVTSASAAQCITCRPAPPPPSGPPPLPRLAEHSITWSDFSGCYSVASDETLCGVGGLPSNDDIQLSTQPGAPYGVGPTQIQIVLQTPPAITWWKEIKAFDAWGNPIGWVDTQNGVHGPVTMTIDTRTAVALVFSKAVALVFPTGIYDLRNLSAQDGKRLVFTWDRDS
jgi:hypothetical protein